jgi:hypothetical protein
VRSGLRSAVFALALVTSVLTMADCSGGSKTAATTSTDTSETETERKSGTAVKRGTAFLTAARCRHYKALLLDFESTLAGVGTTDTQQAAEVFTFAAARAPHDVAGSFQTLADAYIELTDALDGVEPGKYPTPEQIARLEQLSQELDAKHVTQATTNVWGWLRDYCRG